jgi:cell division protein FtsI/penicillin-binding protein 2
VSLIVVIDDPQGSYYGGQVAAPVFRRIGLQVLRALNIAPRFPAARQMLAAQMNPGGKP